MILKCCDECPGDDTCEHARDCCCGNPMDQHALWDGHSPVSMHDYYGTLRTEAPRLLPTPRRRRTVDEVYHLWFAWRPVRLNGPVEWDRMKRTGKRARLKWCRILFRMRNGYSTYYRNPWEESE